MYFKSIRKFFYKIANWESWHYHIKYIPIAPVWLWYCIKARSLWFFTASNPTITFGGFEGEGKKEIYDQLPEKSFPVSVLASHKLTFEEVNQLLISKHLDFPLVVKPDVGAMGYLFRKFSNESQLRKYHSYVTIDYIIQEWIDYPIELSVFYYRMPDKKKGTITGMLMKELPVVVGDGVHSLAELIMNNKVLKLNFDAICARHKSSMQSIIPKGKRFILSHASNRSQGGKLININHEIDEKICSIFDGISNYSKGFFYGRFDLKCESLEGLRNGKNFSILEYNGSGAGIQHVYGNNLSLWKACLTIVRHWEKLYQISRYNKKVNNGFYWKFSEGRKFLNKSMQHLKKLKNMDAAFPV